MTLAQIRERLSKRNRDKRRGWWSGASWTIADTINRTVGDDDRWAKLTWETKTALVARCRAEDTMRAWEQYLSLPKDER